MFYRFRQREDAAFAKGLMFGKAVGARDERERIIELINEYTDCKCENISEHSKRLIDLVNGKK